MAQILYAYDRLTERVDQQIGRLLGALEESGLADDTLVVLTSDHGEGVAAHKWVTKLMLWEEVVRVPFVMRLPGAVPQNRLDSTHLVSGWTCCLLYVTTRGSQSLQDYTAKACAL